MSKITRFFLKVFAGEAANNGQFGSAQLGTKLITNDPETIQALDAYLEGWLSATIGASRLPPLEEMQSVQHVTSLGVAYLNQEGVAEWNADTTYYENGWVKFSGTNQLYTSIVDDNIGNLPTDATKWTLMRDFDVPNPVAKGGTGLATLTANNVILGNGTSNPTFVAPGTSGNVLSSNGTTWTSTSIATAIGSALFPVGSYYMNETVSTNPGTLLGFGTWTAVTDRFIVARGSTYTGTGGSSSVSIAQANLPASVSGVTLQGLLRAWSTGSTPPPGFVGATLGAEGITAGNNATTTSYTMALGSGTALTVNPPYQAAYIWKRTA